MPRRNLLVARSFAGVLCVLLTLILGSLLPAAASADTTATVSGAMSLPNGFSDYTDFSAVLLYSDGKPAIDGSFSSSSSALDSSGAFSITGVSPGTYILEFQDCNLTCSSADGPNEYSGGSYTIYGAQTFTVSTGQNFVAPTYDYQIGASISGEITDPNNYGDYITLVPLAQTPANLAATLGTSTSSSPSSYTVAGLAPGSYNVMISTGYNNMYLTSSDGLSYDAADAAVVTLGPGQNLTDVDVTVPQFATISGTVSDWQSNPLFLSTNWNSTQGTEPFTLEAVDMVDGAPVPTNSSVVTASDGSFTFAGVLPGDYAICVIPNVAVQSLGLTPSDNYSGSYCYGGGLEPTATATTDISVSAGSTASGIDIDVAQGTTISGQVTDTTGRPLYGVNVSLLTSNGWQVTLPVITDANGDYTLTNVPAGSWYIEYQPTQTIYGSTYQTTFSGEAASLTYATPVSTTVSDPATGVDIQLADQQSAQPPQSGLGGGGGSNGSGGSVTEPSQAFTPTVTITLPKGAKFNKKKAFKDLKFTHATKLKALKLTSTTLVVSVKATRKKISFTFLKGAITTKRALITVSVSAKLIAGNTVNYEQPLRLKKAKKSR
jgi:hypothetical protein